MKRQVARRTNEMHTRHEVETLAVVRASSGSVASLRLSRMSLVDGRGGSEVLILIDVHQRFFAACHGSVLAAEPQKWNWGDIAHEGVLSATLVGREEDDGTL